MVPQYVEVSLYAHVLVFVALKACLVADEKTLCADRGVKVLKDFILCLGYVGVRCPHYVLVYVVYVGVDGCVVLVF